MPTEKEEYARPARPPDTSSLAQLREASRNCTACHLYKRATQTVFGEGPRDAPMMLVGEQPGDYEDVASKPFVGPAGKIMDRALEEAGIDRSQVYVTNAVKHFKWNHAENAGFIRNRTRARSRRVAHGSRRSYAWSNRNYWSASGRPRLRRSSGRRSALRANAAKCCHPRLRHVSLPRFTRHLSFDNPTRNRANASTGGSLSTFAPR